MARPTLRRAAGGAAGGRHSCAALGTGLVACWGWNLNDQSSGGPIVDSAADEVVGVTLVEGVAVRRPSWPAGGTAARCSTTAASYAGLQQSGQLGSAETNLVSAPVRAALDVRAVALAAGREQTCATARTSACSSTPRSSSSPTTSSSRTRTRPARLTGWAGRRGYGF